MTVRLRQVPQNAIRTRSTTRLDDFLAENTLPTPFVVVDLDIVADRYRKLADALACADIFYAIKANPAPQILELLVELGSSFDVASPAEIDMVLAAGADPTRISYGNTVKKRVDIEYAYDKGVRLFAFDCDSELDKLIQSAPGANPRFRPRKPKQPNHHTTARGTYRQPRG